jgi:hypothetical protein
MTGCLFFAPPADLLENLAAGGPETTEAPAPATETGDASLRIGSLRDQR